MRDTLQAIGTLAAGVAIVGAGAIVIGLVCLEIFRRRADELHDPALVIVPPVYKFQGQDDNLRKRTEARRRAAETLRQRASQVEAGGQASSVDVLVPGRRRA